MLLLFSVQPSLWILGRYFDQFYREEIIFVSISFLILKCLNCDQLPASGCAPLNYHKTTVVRKEERLLVLRGETTTPHVHQTLTSVVTADFHVTFSIVTFCEVR